MTMSTGDIVLKYVCPSLGSAIALVMWFSPMRDVLNVNRSKELGVSGLDALPPHTHLPSCLIAATVPARP
jgi:hypothetical protein